MPPTTLGPYQLQDELGAGGMATVYRAYQPNMARQVAVKVIYQELADAAGRDQFQREARLIARLEHPHILPVYDFDGQHDPPYIVMRYLAGGTLKDALAQPKFELNSGPWRRMCLRWLQHIADALDYAHRQGIVHRDIKPSNIILDTELNAYLTDFGIALLSGESAHSPDNTVTGTPLYSSPEQALGQGDIGPLADAYALAVVAHEMFARALPFEADSLSDLLTQLAHTPPPPIAKHNPALPARLNEVFFKALAKNPQERFASATAFVDAIAFTLGITFTRAAAHSAAVLPSAPTEQNKIVTLVCVDAANYAAWLEELGRPAAGLKKLWAALQPIIDEHGGTVVEHNEDTLIAAWGAVTTNEDDAEQAVRAGLALAAQSQPFLVDSGQTLSVSAHTGTVTVMAVPAITVTGPALTIVQRLAEQAEGNFLISQDTAQAVTGVFDIEPDAALKVRGRKDPLPTYRVTAAKTRSFHWSLRGVAGLATQLIGREAEMRQLQRAYISAYEENELQTVTVLAEAGLGKSRLLTEFTRWMDLRVEGVWLFQGRATPAMTARPYALLRDILSFRFQILDNDPAATVQEKMRAGFAELIGETPNPSLLPEMADFIGYLAGFDFPDSPYTSGLRHDVKQLVARARQLFMRFWALVATTSPTVLQLEDLQWADAASLELFNTLISEPLNQPLMVLALARPDLFTVYPDWGGGVLALRQNATPSHRLVELAPLDKHDSRDLAREVLQKVADPPKELRDLLVDRAEGNPLFMEELVKILLEDRILIREPAPAALVSEGQRPEVWRVEASRLAHVRVPTSLMSLLQTRLDTLLAPEKIALQRAAVVGKNFFDTALRALEAHDDLTLGDLDPVLERLVERGFIFRRNTSAFAGSREYVFAQTMLREALYASLTPKQQRRYHAGVAQWLNAVSADRRAEYLSLIADHYEKASEFLHALTALREAGEHASALSAYAAARTFLERGLALCPLAAKGQTTDLERTRLQLTLGDVHHQMADFANAQTQAEAALNTAQTLQDPVLMAQGLVQLGENCMSRGDFPKAQEFYEAALPLAQSTSDQVLLARVLFELGSVHWRRGTPEVARSFFNQSLELARALNDVHREIYALNGLGLAARIQGNLDEAEACRKQALELALKVGNRERAMTMLNNLGTIADERRQYPQALDYYQRALGLSRELGALDSAALHLLNLSNTLIKTGDYAAAQQRAREGLTLALQLGSTPWVLWAVVVFARWFAAQEQWGNALALLGLAQTHPAHNNDLNRNIQSILKDWALDPAVVEVGLAQGAALNFDEIVNGLLE